MDLRITKSDNARDGADLRFRVLCQLIVTPEERRRMLKYGAYPLTRPTPGPVDPMKPTPPALMTAADLQEFVTSEDMAFTGTGFTYESDDVRVADDFITSLRVAVAQLWPYWAMAEQFHGQLPDQPFHRPTSS